MSNPLFSIITTVLNGADTIRNLLNSIATQTFLDYELIVVDGGSIDDTVNIVNKINITNKIVQVIPGLGLYAGLNTGIKLATGKWLYFIGADDELHDSNTLQKVAQLITSGNPTTQVFVGSVACIKQETLLHPLLGSPHLLRHQVHHQGIFYNRHIFDKSLYDESMRIASDYKFNLQLALSKVVHQPIDIIVCNFGGNGISENQMDKGYKEMQKIHNKLFTGTIAKWVMSYFWLRRKTGAFLRQYKLNSVSRGLKKLLG